MKQRVSSSEDESTGLMAGQVLFARLIDVQDSWIVDSGASCHMCNDENLFVELCCLENPLEIVQGNGYTVEAPGRGDVALEVTTTGGKVEECKLHEVLYVPNLSHNLLSVSKATKSGKTVEFSEAGCEMDEDRKLIATATRVGSLYYLKCRKDRQKMNVADKRCSLENKGSIWHRRYGHLGARNLEELVRHNMVDGFDYNSSTESDLCESCAAGKIHRCKFQQSSRRSEEKLGLVHSDVCGKMGTKSLGDGEYFLTFIDDKTRYLWIYILKSKDEVFQKFLEWKALAENSSGHKLNVLRTDNRGEYTSAEFESYLKREGIRHERTIPKTPEQNGVAERKNRTLVESVRSMLADAKLPRKFWAEALSTAVYLQNRSPTKALNKMTQYQAWRYERPTVNHLRIFGCTAFAHVSKDERKKLDSKARKCIFLGYRSETKGYRLYDPERRRVFHSRDVNIS